MGIGVEPLASTSKGSGTGAPNQLCGVAFHVCNSSATDQTKLESITQPDASRLRRATQHSDWMLEHQRCQ